MTTDERAIRDLVALWHSATAAGEAGTVLGLMTEDVVFLVAGNPPIRGRAAFEPVARLARATSDRVVERYPGSRSRRSLAYCWSDLSVRVVPLAGGGASSLRAGPALTILRKQSGGSWAVVRDANLMVERS